MKRHPHSLPQRITQLAILLWLPAWAALAASPSLPRVRVDSEGTGFVQEGKGGFVPFGVNYFRPGTGWAPQVWKRFDPEATRQDFALMKSTGVNCVRVFLTYGSFMNEPGVLMEEGLARLDRFLEIAAEAGIYVHPTGPDHWEGLPEWARGDRIADEKVLAALEKFWTQLAARYRHRPVVFAYDLLNEPEVRWDSPVMHERWNRWLTDRYSSATGLSKAWGREVAESDWGAIAIPPRQDAPGDRALLDYQRFREDVADEWTRRQTAAIKAADPDALVTVGLIQWSVPTVLAGAFHYSGFRPDRQARWVDFQSVHFYPLADGPYHYSGPEAEARNLAYLESVVAEVARPGKPVVIGEFGWYGGGRPSHVGGAMRAASEAEQARWCRAVVESTAGLATGWLNWGFFDHPEARDVTELIGLAKPDGTLKDWGRTFQGLNRTLAELPRRVIPTGRPSLDWDACLTDAAARKAFQSAYEKAWLADPETQSTRRD
jgi:hypothetical protein